MKKNPRAVRIEIRNSVIGGDVVAGDKTVIVHLHEDQLGSADAILEALVQQGQMVAAGDAVIQAMLSNPKLAARYEAAKLAQDREYVDQLIDTTIRDHQRSGTSSEMLTNLWAAVDKARKAEDWLSFSKSGSALLALLYNKSDAGDDTMRLADELVSLGQRDAQFARNIPVARIYQAGYLYHRLFGVALELRTATELRRNVPVATPLVNLRSELKRGIEFSALSNAYASQALSLAFESGDPSVGIYVLFAFITLQNNHHFLYHLMLGGDGRELAERILSTTRILEELIKKFGSESDMAMMFSNTAAFWLQTREYEKAETLAFLAAQKFSSLGDANSAKRAMSIMESARKREPVLRGRPTDADVEAAPIEEIISMMRNGIEQIGKLHGIDTKEPTIKAAIELGFKDFTPERVLRSCEHIVVDCATSELGATLGVPSIGLKIIGCQKFRRRVQAIDLDRAFDSFKERLGCNQCEHRSPRQADWKWSLNWASDNAEERARNGEPPLGPGYY